MANEQKKETSQIYQIKIQGHLDIKWSEWFYGLSIAHEPDGTTTLSGALLDQVILHSVLDRLRDMNLTLLSVNQVCIEQAIHDDDQGGSADE